jgi:uncharacterized protein (TIGR02145 family)
MNKASLIISAVLISTMLSIFSLVSCEQNPVTSQSSTYNEVIIGEQMWMKENLNVDKFRNGDSIQQAKTDEEWLKARDNKEPAWCYFNNDPTNGTKYGKLYNWYAVNDPRGLAPQGWHVPSDAEWRTLTDYLGGISAAGDKMKSTTGWSDSGNGNNSSGFSGLPGGNRLIAAGFYGLGIVGGWWSSTEDNTIRALSRILISGSGVALRDNNYKKDGFSVRCLRD